MPVILLKKEHYQHKSYGKIYTPVFDIKEWVGMDAEASEETAEEDAPASRRRRSV